VAVFTGLNRKGSRRLIEQGYLSETITNSQSFLDFIVGDDLHHPLLNDEEAHGF
jgi:hypothetical protein